MAEIYNNKSDKSNEVDRELAEIRRASQERASDNMERARDSVERSKETFAEARGEALELAKSRERKTKNERVTGNTETKRDVIANKADRDKAYKNIMDVTRTQMSAPARAFSKVIHNPFIEKTSEVVGSTIARPNAILTGSVSALILVLGVYTIAHFFGYPLSGFETIGAFILGWLIGIIYDFFYAMITGKVN